MGARRYSTEQIIVKLREAEIETWSEPLVRTKESESRLGYAASGLHQQTRHEAHGARFARLLGLDEE